MPTMSRVQTTLGELDEEELDQYISEHAWRIYEQFRLIADDPTSHRAHIAALWIIPERLRLLVREHCNLVGELFIDDVLRRYSENGAYPCDMFSKEDVSLLAQALDFSMGTRYEALAHHINTSAHSEVRELPSKITFHGRTNPDVGGRLWLAVDSN